jgi:hypothetical protein
MSNWTKLRSAMLWSGITASEALLPRECQLPAARARRRSWRIRIHIAVLLVLYTCWVGFQVVASLFNTQRDSKDAFARKLPRNLASDAAIAIVETAEYLKKAMVQTQTWPDPASRSALNPPTLCRVSGMVILDRGQQVLANCYTACSPPVGPVPGLLHHSNLFGLAAVLQR